MTNLEVWLIGFFNLEKKMSVLAQACIYYLILPTPLFLNATNILHVLLSIILQ